MATIGEMTGGRDGFSCTRPVMTSKDWRNIEGIVEKKEEKNVELNADKVKQEFRKRRT